MPKVISHTNLNSSRRPRTRFLACAAALVVFSLSTTVGRGGDPFQFEQLPAWRDVIIPASEPIHTSYLLAEQYATKGNYISAVIRYRHAARANHAQAQAKLGYCYERGLGVTRNIRIAKQWYRKAARAGDRQARASLIRLLPKQPSFEGVSPWFVETDKVDLLWNIRDKVLVLAAVPVKVPRTDAVGEWKIGLPVYVYRDHEIDAITTPRGEVKTDKLPAPALSDFAVPTAIQLRAIRDRYRNKIIAICYPPYIAIKPSANQWPQGADARIRDYLEHQYESAASKLKPIWGFWKSDGYFYTGHVVSKKGNRVLFQFDDGLTARLTDDEFAKFVPQVGDRVQGNWRGGGRYYSGRIIAINDNRIRLRYDDGAVEDTTLASVRIRLEAKPAFGK